jgi:gliding motility-associated-like protein
MNITNYIQMKKLKIHEVFFLLLSLIPTMVQGQAAEYNATTNWMYPGAQKFVGQDFINSPTGQLINNGQIIYGGNFTNNGEVDFKLSLACDPALSTFAGTSQTQQISGTKVPRFYRLSFDHKLVYNAFDLQQNIKVASAVDFKNGIVVASPTADIEFPKNLLLFEAEATVGSVSDKSFVDGFVSKTGKTAFTFPIGNGRHYRPLGITAPAAIADCFQARYIYQNPDSKYSIQSKAADIYRVSNKEYWVLNRTLGVSNPQVTLSWDVSKTSDRIPSNLKNLSIVRWDQNSGKWVNEGDASTTTTTGNNKQGTITSSVSGYGIFTLGMLTSALPVATVDNVSVLEDVIVKDIDVLANDVCSNGEIIKFNSFKIGETTYQPGATVTIPNTGTITATETGVFTFVPVLNFSGALPPISYTISDIDDNKATAQLLINVLPMPEVVKKSSLPFLNSNGSFSWIYTISIKNDTPYKFESIQVEDNLDDVLIAKNCTYTVTSIKATGGLTANGLYNGSSNMLTLIPGGKMVENETDTIEIEVNVDTHGRQDTVPVLNQALFTAQATFGKVTLKTDADVTTSIAEPTETKIPISKILVTEGFSPNGDGINDYYVIAHDELTKLSIDIYNRTGYIIYHSSDYQNDWDGKGTGKYAGQDIENGTYFCSYKAIKRATGEVVATGTKFITIHR